MKMTKTKKFLGVLIFIAVAALGIAVAMLLWNALIPQIIGWTTINYWQAAGLLILCRLLFGGFGKFGHGGCGRHRRFFGGHGRKHSHVFEKMEGMSRQERREYMKEHIRRFHPFDDDDRRYDDERRYGDEKRGEQTPEQ
ncbi:hypothetical protein [Dysgonomonas sp. ZJ279]|uniref:hypothetical protein n=1 Tax=Dysgonomonas sp. ZJ279 TaxID=2709796 RepID=UPI0016287CD0|nr:hypothetical protein [Dysgonomonas sp. ZJ279]